MGEKLDAARGNVDDGIKNACEAIEDAEKANELPQQIEHLIEAIANLAAFMEHVEFETQDEEEETDESDS